MKTMDDWFAVYGESHQNETNKVIHWICVPTIFFSILGLLYQIKLPFIAALLPDAIAWAANVSSLLILFGIFFYARLSIVMTLGMIGVVTLTLMGIWWIEASPLSDLWTHLGIFVAAWIGQFYGHKIEGKKPSFFQDLQFLLIGPAWVMGFLFRKLGVKY